MEHPYIIPYLEQRMKEMGFKKFHFETVVVNNINFGNYGFGSGLDLFWEVLQSDNRYGKYVKQIDASNHFYYLVKKTVSSDLKITSDTGYLLPSESVDYSNYTFHNFREFTGQIFITDTAPFELEFIRAIPYE